MCRVLSPLSIVAGLAVAVAASGAPRGLLLAAVAAGIGVARTAYAVQSDDRLASRAIAGRHRRLRDHPGGAAERKLNQSWAGLSQNRHGHQVLSIPDDTAVSACRLAGTIARTATRVSRASRLLMALRPASQRPADAGRSGDDETSVDRVPGAAGVRDGGFSRPT
jgi:hypothetical protein